jgi:hypothetical protein
MYLFGFSVYVMGHLVAELAHGVREPWLQACIPVVLCLSLSAVPAIIAIGLWACDDFARMLAIGFALFDVVIVVLFAQQFRKAFHLFLSCWI